MRVQDETVWLNLNQIAQLFDRDKSVISRHIHHQEKIDFFVRTSLPPVEQVFFEGEFFEARVLLERIIKTAKKLSCIDRLTLSPEVVLNYVT